VAIGADGRIFAFEISNDEFQIAEKRAAENPIRHPPSKIGNLI
jgi:hypothetical protein